MKLRLTYFALFMTLLGIVSSMMMRTYQYAMSELIVDVIIVCGIVSLCPRKARTVIMHTLAVAFFGIAIVDNFCFQQFSMPLSSTTFLLLNETNAQEASEFFSKYITLGMLSSRISILFLLLLLYILTAVAGRHLPRRSVSIPSKAKKMLAMALLSVTVIAGYMAYPNYCKLTNLLLADNIDEYTRLRANDDEVALFLPVYRFATGLKEYKLSERQLEELKKNVGRHEVSHKVTDGVSIFLVIGESHNKYNSSLYGYNVPTTPHQKRLYEAGKLIRFDDAVAPANLTSYCFKYIFSLKCSDDTLSWTDYPLFPELFRKAGYRVSLYTNQFVKSASESMFDVNTASFIVDKDISPHLFDFVNTVSFKYDGELIDYYSHQNDTVTPSLTIFHLKGQHYEYYERYPDGWDKWSAKDFEHNAQYSKLTHDQLSTLAEYNNATLYNDHVLHRITQLAEKKNAMVIYLSDHSEQVFNGGSTFNGRHLTASTDRDIMKYEYEVPMWVYFPDGLLNGELYNSTKTAARKRFYTDRLAKELCKIISL